MIDIPKHIERALNAGFSWRAPSKNIPHMECTPKAVYSAVFENKSYLFKVSKQDDACSRLTKFAIFRGMCTKRHFYFYILALRRLGINYREIKYQNDIRKTELKKKAQEYVKKKRQQQLEQKLQEQKAKQAQKNFLPLFGSSYM